MTESPTPPTQPETANDAVDPDKTAKFLANLKRTIQKADPDDAPAPKPAAKPTPVVAEVPPAPAPKKPARRRAKPAAGDEGGVGGVSMNIRLDPGTATKVVYIRVDKTLADRLQLIAFQNKITGGDGPDSINDIGIEALTDWLEQNAA